MVETPLTDEELRSEALKRIKKKRDFAGHLAAYVVINAFLVGVWYFTGREYFWPVWVMIGWGIGLVLNAWEVFLRRPVTESDVTREMEKLRGTDRTLDE
jgi:hypothetical protein